LPLVLLMWLLVCFTTSTCHCRPPLLLHRDRHILGWLLPPLLLLFVLLLLLECLPTHAFGPCLRCCWWWRWWWCLLHAL
jgi:hypothetical protein